MAKRWLLVAINGFFIVAFYRLHKPSPVDLNERELRARLVESAALKVNQSLKSEEIVTFNWSLRKGRIPFASDAECSHLRTSFVTPKSAPMIALWTFPSSGNTWTRHLVESLTGVFTGDLYNDQELGKVFWGSKEKYWKRNTFVVKTHQPNVSAQFDMALSVLRNPLDVCKGYFAFNKTKSHVRSFNGKAKELNEFTLTCIQDWSLHVR